MVLHFALSLWSIIFPRSGILSMWNPTLEEGVRCWRFHSPLPRIQDHVSSKFSGLKSKHKIRLPLFFTNFQGIIFLFEGSSTGHKPRFSLDNHKADRLKHLLKYALNIIFPTNRSILGQNCAPTPRFHQFLWYLLEGIASQEVLGFLFVGESLGLEPVC